MIDERGPSGAESITDSELCDLIRSGEAWPLATLWERYHAVAVGWAKRKDVTYAEDAVSDAFDSIYRALLDGGGPTESFTSYLFRTITSQLSKHWRADNREISLDDFDAEKLESGASDDHLADLEEQDAAAAALDDLPLRWKHVILAVDVAGKPVQEVAADLELTPNSTSVLLKRAREGLKRSWLKQMHPPRGLAADCAACVSDFSEMRWGRKGSRKAARASAHVEGCPQCKARWRRFAEQASVIGMVSTGVIAMERGWKRKALLTAAACASAGALVVAAGVAIPALQGTTDVSELPTSPLQGPTEPGDGAGDVDRDVAGSAGGGSSETTAAGPGGTVAEGYVGSTRGDAASEGEDMLPGEGVPAGFESMPTESAEIPNTGHVNVNDLDLDGDGVPGTPTNTVWTRWGTAAVVKVDARDAAIGLPGAKFLLWASEQPEGCRTAQQLTPVVGDDGEAMVIESGKNGVLEIPPLWVGDDEIDGGKFSSGLSARCYVLEEIVAPTGYLLPIGQAARSEIIVRGWDTAEAVESVTIPNTAEPGSWLARTGQSGQLLIAGGGALLLVAGGLVVAARPRRG
ncbi:sigma-70 family RNA polymerase sigma factor [Leucobacter aridicollis]|uniref:sigma-70 family RNA polymerase sigma factor n=1 Tax=Leucobacter aridicollis TaxID=283878 RepID=UPI00210443FF|nr:sigma-70 family RNA polymerase sigma factor [Leucobacter aridicollis]UTX53101.1 sigma-70 family RNA polymerase sigma factor [Leucobacter aridicollis]